MNYRIYLESSKWHFDQWDKGQRLVIEGIPAGTNVDFSPYKNEVYMRKAYAEGSSIYVNVPDVALQKSGVLKCYFYVNHSDSRGETVYRWSVNVAERPKPSDYVHTEEEIRDYESLKARIDELENTDIRIADAKIGQTVRIADVDENGVPTKWEPVDMPEHNLSDNSAIIDVVELPSDGIRQDAMYRIITAKCIVDQYDLTDNHFICYCVDGLPKTGIAVSNLDMNCVNAYYNIRDKIVYGYIEETLSSALGIPVGWHDLGLLMSIADAPYSGVIADISDDPCDSALRILLFYDYYVYKNEWTKLVFAYEKAPKFDITWDGDMTGRSALDMSMLGYSQGVYFVKVSDDVFTTDELIGWTAKAKYNDGTVYEDVVDLSSIDTTTYPGAFLIGGSIIVLHDADTTATALGIPTGIYTNGVYFWLYTEEGYVSNLTSPVRITKIDEKYLPDMSVDASSLGLHSVATSGNYNDLYNKPAVYTDVIRYNYHQSLSVNQQNTVRSQISVYSKSEVDDKLYNANYVTYNEVQNLIAAAIGSAIGGSY